MLDGTKVRVGDEQYQLLTRLNLTTGAMTWQHTTQVQHENRFALTHEPLPAGALRLADLGFFHLETFAQLNRERVYWLTRYKIGTTLYDQVGQPLDLSACLGPAPVDRVVGVGQQRLPAQIATQRQEHHRQHAREKLERVAAALKE